MFGDGSVNNYLNRAAFTSPDPGTYSTLKPNAFVGPSQFQNDLAITRTFRLAGNQFQFRWEVFNVLNTAELQQPDVRAEQHELRPDPVGRPAADHAVRVEVQLLTMRSTLAWTAAACLTIAWPVPPGAQPAPARKHVLAWADVRNGYQHEAISHAMATIERLGRQSGLYDTYIRTDSQLVTKQPITFRTGTGIATGEQFLAHNLNYFDAIFFFGVREIDLTAEQKADLLSFVKDDGKGFVAAHSGATAFFSWPEFGEMLGGASTSTRGASPTRPSSSTIRRSPRCTGFRRSRCGTTSTTS